MVTMFPYSTKSFDKKQNKLMAYNCLTTITSLSILRTLGKTKELLYNYIA